MVSVYVHRMQYLCVIIGKGGFIVCVAFQVNDKLPAWLAGNWPMINEEPHDPTQQFYSRLCQLTAFLTKA